MALDTDKIDEAVLALLFLTRHDHWRAWKGFDWDALSRLHDKGMIADPVNKAKSVVFTEEGLKCAALPGHVHQARVTPGAGLALGEYLIDIPAVGSSLRVGRQSAVSWRPERGCLG